MEVIKELFRGIIFKITVSGLPTGRNYVANLYDTPDNAVSAEVTLLEEDKIMFTWTAEQTKQLPVNALLTLEIYDEYNEVIFPKKKFAKVTDTSVG